MMTKSNIASIEVNIMVNALTLNEAALGVNDCVWRKRHLRLFLNVSERTVDRLETNDPAFPKRFDLGNGHVGWWRSEIIAWALERKRGRQPPPKSIQNKLNARDAT